MSDLLWLELGPPAMIRSLVGRYVPARELLSRVYLKLIRTVDPRPTREE
jgi:hypothetical protein